MCVRVRMCVYGYICIYTHTTEFKCPRVCQHKLYIQQTFKLDDLTSTD